MTPHDQAAGSPTTQIVVFRVGGSEYALGVEAVAEVLRMVAISPLPGAPEWQPGVINLRGRVIPIVDLRLRLGLEPAAYGLNTPIVVSSHASGSVGLVADAVTELLTLPVDAIEPPDGLAADDGPVKAVARHGDRLILVADLGRLCAGAESAQPAAA